MLKYVSSGYESTLKKRKFLNLDCRRVMSISESQCDESNTPHSFFIEFKDSVLQRLKITPR